MPSVLRLVWLSSGRTASCCGGVLAKRLWLLAPVRASSTRWCGLQLALGIEALVGSVGLGASVALRSGDSHPDIRVLTDNQAARQMAKDALSWRSRPYINRAWYLSEGVRQGRFCVEYVATGDMAADGLTKFLPPVVLAHSRDQLGLISLEAAASSA